MNLLLNPTLTMSMAADRRHTLVAEAELRRIRKADRLARKAAARASVSVEAPLSPVVAPIARPQLHPVPTGSAVVRQNVASSDHEHASARVA